MSGCGASKRASPRLLAAIVLVFGLAALGCARMQGPDEGWITLIDGPAGLDNWNRIGDANWRGEEGAIVADGGKGGYLVSRHSYADFQVRAEFWADPATNSGIFLRLADAARVSSRNAYEVNIHDQSPDKAYGTGSIVKLAPTSSTHHAAGRWSAFEITARGRRVTVALNGVRTVEFEDGRFSKGPLALQYREGPIKWRRVQVRELPP